MIGWLDCGAGASGDMFLGALVDAGVPVDHLRAVVGTLGVEPIGLRAEPAARHAIRATRVHVTPEESHTHRHWSDVREIVTDAALPEPVRDTALDAFGRLARAEAAVHGTSPDEVHFHEVGALDAIADIVGACAGVDWLRTHRGLATLSASAVTLGGGRARGAHGSIPVPGPAVLGILGEAGAPVTGGNLPYEACTPTGAALLATHVSAWGGLPPMRVGVIGVGAGGRDPSETANVLRLVLGDPTDARAPGSVDGIRTTSAGNADDPGAGTAGRRATADRPADESGPRSAGETGNEAVGGSSMLECNVDDLDPRLWPAVLGRLLAAGASDAWLTPILMKKGRPAHTLHVLCHGPAVEAVRAVVFAETSSIGLRSYPVRKEPLDRASDTVEVDGQPVRIKLARSAGTVVNVSVEYDDVAAAAAALDVPAKQILARATAAAQHHYRNV